MNREEYNSDAGIPGGLSSMYSIENIANEAGVSVSDFKKSVQEHTDMKNRMIQRYVDEGYTLGHATSNVIRILYIS